MIIRPVLWTALLNSEQWALLTRPGMTQAIAHSILAQAFPSLDERELNLFLHDGVFSRDTYFAEVASLVTDATASTDVLHAVDMGAVVASYSGSGDSQYAGVSWGIYEGGLANYFLEDYVLDSSYNVPNNWSTDVFSGWVQNYALDPSYFAGDYASTQFI